MNLVLFEKGELVQSLPDTDPRVRHIRNILRRSPGDSFDCGMVNGPRGKATVEEDGREGMRFSFDWREHPPALPPVCLLVGLPRPQSARKVLREATALGVGRIVFFSSEKSEASYARSSLWHPGEIRRHLIEGAAQAFCTRLPEVEQAGSLQIALASATPAETRLALDNYEAPQAMTNVTAPGLPAVLAVGGERGWSNRERDAFRDQGYSLIHLGRRILRTETACVAGITLLLAKLRLLEQ